MPTNDAQLAATSPRTLRRSDLAGLIDALRGEGYRVLGPRVRDGAIVHDEIRDVEELPIGWTAMQEAGAFRLRRRDDEAVFGWAVGPHSWRASFFAPRTTLVRLRRRDEAFEVEPIAREAPRLALFGARSCDLAAIEVQDRVFLGGSHPDEDYAARRRDVFVVAVNCGEPGGTCFCVSMDTGPRARGGYDLALTELLDGGDHRFLVEIGSTAGERILATIPTRAASEEDARASRAVTDRAAARMGRALDTRGIRDLLFRNLEHPRWDEVATRCLSCTNCTLVCPTCFCSTVEDTTDLAGEVAERTRVWDSCFTLGHSYVHGGHARPTTRGRYRQWLTHKLAGWIDQYGTSGCVGCGRCITWCPTAIDITEECAAIRATDGATGAAS